MTISISARDPTRTSEGVPPKSIPLSSNRQLSRSIGLQADDDDTTASNRIAGSIPLTLPAILRHSKTKVNSGPTRTEETVPRASTSSGRIADEIRSKRRRRRYENAQLAGNPHITRPSRIDLFPGPVAPASTTFVPPPKSFSRSVYVPGSATSINGSLPPDPSSTTHGAFSLSLRGLRREIRAMSGRRPNSSLQGVNRTEELVNTIESQLHDWLSMSTRRARPGYYHVSPTSVDMSSRLVGGRVIDATPVEDWTPPTNAMSAMGDGLLSDLPTSSHHVGTTTAPEPPASITEILRSPAQLVWSLPSPHARYLLHAVARYYRLQSFSRAISPLDPNVRVTHVLRTTMLRPTVGGFQFETPPATDLSEFSATSASEESDASSSVHGDDEGDTGSEFEYAGDETFETIRPQVWTPGLASDHEEFVTDDEASTTDDAGLTESESISSSIAELALANSALRPASLPFGSLPLNGALSPALSDARPSRAEQRARPHVLFDSSPSRSPDRQARTDPAVATFGAARAANWALPTVSFVDFLYA